MFGLSVGAPVEACTYPDLVDDAYSSPYSVNHLVGSNAYLGIAATSYDTHCTIHLMCIPATT
jgi:hypothetical protein